MWQSHPSRCLRCKKKCWESSSDVQGKAVMRKCDFLDQDVHRFQMSASQDICLLWRHLMQNDVWDSRGQNMIWLYKSWRNPIVFRCPSSINPEVQASEFCCLRSRRRGGGEGWAHDEEVKVNVYLTDNPSFSHISRNIRAGVFLGKRR